MLDPDYHNINASRVAAMRELWNERDGGGLGQL